MNNRNNQFIWLIVLILTLTGCSKEIMLDDDNTSSSSSSSDATSTLIVKTRALSVNGTDSKVSFPIYVYVFNSSSNCVATPIIHSASESMNIKLSKGIYHVYAIAGATADNYTLPQKEDVSPKSVIKLNEGAMHGELMVAQSTISLGKDQTNTLTLALKRKVMQLQSLMIKDVPENISAVTVTFSPLYANMKLDGTYDDGIGSQTFSLIKDGQDNKTWKLSAPSFLLEAQGEANITVALTQGEQIKSYTYISKEELKANYKINITGTYNDEFELSGTIKGEDWAGDKDIAFDLTSDEDINEPTPGKPDTEDKDYGTPVVGQLYALGQCYVVNAQDNGNGTITYLLMTTKRGEKVVSESEEIGQTELKARVEKIISQLSVTGISGWRLPTKDEISLMKEQTDSYSNLVDKSKSMTINHTYFYQKDANTIDAIKLADPQSHILSNALTRAFTTLTVSK